MWILENDGDALNGKKLWLRPGKKFVFGRTAPKDPEEGDIEQLFVVSDKTISRKHLTIEIDPVGPSECADLRTRSRLTLTDLDTKIGTLVNDEQIKGTSRVLDKDNNRVQLGRHKHLFRFTWVPVVFTFSFTSKEKKANPYQTLYDRLGPLDIKALDDYKCGLTTHVVAKKRNTAKGLQALIDGKYIVHNDTFINAVIAAAHPKDNGGAPLEEDFEGNWPDERQFLPPKGEEPTTRRDDAYAPNHDRLGMFDGYTFVFYARTQFDTLLAPITNGRGKALFREVVPNETTVDEFVRYVKGVAGEKGLGEFEDGSVGRGVVVVRFNPVAGDSTHWYAEFGREVALKLDQRLVEQNEFLDVILGSNASVLRRPLDFISSAMEEPPPATAALTSSQPIQSNQPAPVTTPAPTPAQEQMPPPETSRRARSRRARGQVRSFLDDDFSGPLVMHSIPEAAEVAPSPAPMEEPESQGLFVSQDPETQVHREPSQPPEPVTRSMKKRAASILSEDEDVMEVLAPTTAAIKRRRLAEELDRKRRGESTPPPPQPTPPVIKKETPKADPVKPPAKKSRKVKELSPDPIEEARIRREEAEAAAQAEREFLEAQFDGMDIEDIRKKIVIEEIEVKRAQPPPRLVAHADESERWEDKWNGRKNFKRFRRRGADNSQRIEKVIVALEEVKNRNYGIGDEYWESGENNMQRKKDKGHDTQDSGSRPQSRVAAEPEQDEFDSGSNDLPTISQHKPNVDINSSDESELETMRKPAPKVTTAISSRNSQKLVDKTRESRSVSIEPGNKKRPAPASTARAPPAKKMRQTNIKPIGRQESDDESDDGLKFKLRRKR